METELPQQTNKKKPYNGIEQLENDEYDVIACANYNFNSFQQTKKVNCTNNGSRPWCRRLQSHKRGVNQIN